MSTVLEAAGQVTALPWVAPEAAFRCFADDEFVAFLHSGGAIGPRSRYSYLCVDPFKVLRGVSLHAVSQALARYRPPQSAAPVPFAGGAVGFIGYETGADGEDLPCAPGRFEGVPGLQFCLFDIVFAWDHAAGKCFQLRAFAEAENRAEVLRARLMQGAVGHDLPRLVWQGGVSRAAHMARVSRCLDYIQAGDIYQANITAPFRATRPAGLRAADVFLALHAASPAPFSAFIGTGAGCGVASVSPERFIRLGAKGAIETRPIKGTRARGITAAEDAAAAADLLGSDKDRAENLMIVDLLRNDISRVAVPGSVRVPVLCALESFASVHHLVSVIEGKLRSGLTAVDLLRAAFPGGSITGAPKIRAMQIITELEGAARGPYCGTAAWLGFDGAMDSNILIRTVTVAEDVVVAQAGGGIVADSDPAAEWDELMVKIGPLLHALGEVA